jgi:hypothetical protein
VGRSQVQNQPRLHTEFEASFRYIVRACQNEREREREEGWEKREQKKEEERKKEREEKQKGKILHRVNSFNK